MDESTPPETHSTRLATAVWLAAAAVVAIAPLILSPAGYDVLRLPKELVYRGGAIVAGALLLIAGIWQSGVLRRTLALPRIVGLWIAAVSVWTLITTLTSTHRTLSWFSFGWTLASLTLFVALLVAPKGDDLRTLAVLFVPTLVNAAVLFAQKLTDWDPFRMAVETPETLRLSALIGNPNDVGAFFFFPALVAICATLVVRNWWRYVLGAIALLCVLAIVVAETRTALLALFGSLIALVWVLGRRRLMRFLVPAAVVAAIAIVFFFSSYRSVRRLAEGNVVAKLESITSGRLLPAMAAAQMALDHPLLGVGPGTYGFQYMPYKFRVQQKYPAIAAPSSVHFLNFGEVHNDHLEVAAETGFIGYLLFVAALVLVARCSLVNPAEDESRREHFVRLFALPFAAGFALLALAQFPLQIAATSLAAIFCAATCIRWSART